MLLHFIAIDQSVRSSIIGPDRRGSGKQQVDRFGMQTYKLVTESSIPITTFNAATVNVRCEYIVIYNSIYKSYAHVSL